MKKTAKIFALLVIFICVIVELCSCQSGSIKLNKDKSFYSDYRIENDNAYIYCTLFIENKSDTEKFITVQASFEEDAKNGLLKEALVYGYYIDENTKEIQLQKGENQIDVVFIGEYAGTSQKLDRLLPDIKIEELNPSPTATDGYYNTYNNFKETFTAKFKEDVNFTVYSSEKYAGLFYEIFDNSGNLLDEGFHDWRGSFDIIKKENIITLEYGYGGNSQPKYRFYDAEKSLASRFFDGPVATNGDLIAYFCTKDDRAYLVVQNIFNIDTYYCEFSDSFDNDIYLKCAAMEFSEDSVMIKYYTPENPDNFANKTFALK